MITTTRLPRPKLWFLGPALLSLLLMGIAHKELLWPLLCGLGILSTYFTNIEASWPTKDKRLRNWLLLAMGWVIGYLYFLVILKGGQGLHYFPRFLLKPWFYTPGALLSAGLLAYVWHTPFYPKERGWAIYALSGWIVICSGQMYRPGMFVVVLILLYCIAVLFTLLFAAPGRQLHGIPWRPARRQVAWMLCWLTIIGGSSWGVIRGLHRLEEDMARLIGELLRLPTYSGTLGASGTVRLRRKQNVRLSERMVATLSGTRPPGYLRTRVLTRYRKGMWSSHWRLSRWLPSKSLPQGHTRFQMATHQTPRWQPVDKSTLEIQTFLSLRGAMLMAYGSTHLTVRAHARCRQSLATTLDCMPLHLLYRYQVKRTKAARLPMGIYPALAGAMTLPAEAFHWRHLQRPKPRARKQPVAKTARAPATTSGPMPASRPAQPTSQRRARKTQKGRAPQQRPGHLLGTTHPTLRPLLKKLYPLAQRVAGKHKDNALAAAMAVQSYFRQHYTYSLKVKLAAKGDPTLDFVFNKRPAYCQYFASGMALVMRSLGHRARVANGFLVREYNEYAQRWLVRERDAHAWTEVFDPVTRRWIAFDATPPAMRSLLQANLHKGTLDQLSAWLQIRWREFVAAARNVRFGEWLRARSLEWLEALSRPENWSTIVALILLIWSIRNRSMLWDWWRRQWAALWGREAPHRPSSAPTNPAHVQARALLQETLAAWHPFGIALQEHETLEALRDRLAQKETKGPGGPEMPLDTLGAFIELYNLIRFTPESHWQDSDAPPPLEDLKALAHALQPAPTSTQGDADAERRSP